MTSWSLKRYLNFLKAGYSYGLSSLTHRPVIHGFPPALGIELTNYCNLACPGCITGAGLLTRDQGFMEEKLFNKILDELHPYLLTISLYFQGEPMLHPQFISFLEKCRGLFSIVSTNGHFIDEEISERMVLSGLRRLVISIDGADQKTYSRYRINGDLEKVFAGIGMLNKAKVANRSDLQIVIQFLVNRYNEHQTVQMKKLTRSLNVSLKFKSMQLTDNIEPEEWIPSKGHFSRYKMKEGRAVIKNKLPNRCARLWLNPVVTWDGKVIPCCFDKDAHHVMGDLNEDSFADIWDGPRYRIFRKSVLSGRNEIEICRNCTSGIACSVRKNI